MFFHPFPRTVFFGKKKRPSEEYDKENGLIVASVCFKSTKKVGRLMIKDEDSGFDVLRRFGVSFFFVFSIIASASLSLAASLVTIIMTVLSFIVLFSSFLFRFSLLPLRVQPFTRSLCGGGGRLG